MAMLPVKPLSKIMRSRPLPSKIRRLPAIRLGSRGSASTIVPVNRILIACAVPPDDDGRQDIRCAGSKRIASRPSLLILGFQLSAGSGGLGAECIVFRQAGPQQQTATSRLFLRRSPSSGARHHENVWLFAHTHFELYTLTVIDQVTPQNFFGI